MSPMPALATAPAAASSSAFAVISAARALLPHLERGKSLDAAALRAAMVSACGGSDAEGAWTWKEAYEAGEAAQVLFLRKFGPTMRTAPPHRFLSMLDRVAALLPSQTRRSPESQALQQFSTPIPLGSVVARAAGIGPADLVLEPSAGTGLLAIFAELAEASLLLNERAELRAAILAELFPRAGLTRFDAARIDDHLDPALRPTVVLMNPPFSAEILVERRMAEAGLRHLASALARLAPGGRLVAITGAGLSSDSPTWHDGFVCLQTQGRIPGARPHPTRLVQSAAMASVAPPKPSYRPYLPPGCCPTPNSRA